MKLKLDKDGNVIIKDGKPVYEMEDGTEFVADVPDMYGKTIELKGESKRSKEALTELQTKFDAFKELLPVTELDELKTWKEKAVDALEKLKSIDQKKLLDSGKLDEIKAELQEAHDQNLGRVKQEYEVSIEKLNKDIESRKNQIFQLMVGNAFANSRFFSGKDPLTVLTPEIALSHFGKHFKVVEDPKTKELSIVGQIDDNEIMSRQDKRVGMPADVEEALEYIINRYPHKDRILTAGKPGSGGTGGSGEIEPQDEIGKLQKQHQEAIASGNMTAAMGYKRKISELQNASG